MINLHDVNNLPPTEFVARFGDVAEHSPWVAEGALQRRPFGTRDIMIDAFESTLRSASEHAQLALLRAHPDLATKARLTADSTAEQRGAGLTSLTAAEFSRFTALNRDYKTRFGFPFIFAVKGATKHQIMESFDARIENSRADEFELALQQVMRIFRFRIEDRVSAE